MEQHIERIYQLLFEIEEVCTKTKKVTVKDSLGTINRKVKRIYNILGKVAPNMTFIILKDKSLNKKGNPNELS